MFVVEYSLHPAFLRRVFPDGGSTKLNIMGFRLRCSSNLFCYLLQMVEECGKRFSKDEQGGAHNEEERAEELLGLVNEVFPRPPIKQEDELEVDMKDI